MKIELNILARIDSNPAQMISTIVVETREGAPLNEGQLNMILERAKAELLEKINQLNEVEH